MEQPGRPLLHCSSAPERRGAGLEANLGLPHARSASARLELAPSECTPSDSGAGEKVRRRRAGFWRASAVMPCHVCRVTARQRPAELDRWGATPSEWPSGPRRFRLGGRCACRALCVLLCRGLSGAVDMWPETYWRWRRRCGLVAPPGRPIRASIASCAVEEPSRSPDDKADEKRYPKAACTCFLTAAS